MRKLSVFNFVTLNGFYKGAADDISWHKSDILEGDYKGRRMTYFSGIADIKSKRKKLERIIKEAHKIY
jgi:hypothetical protein